MSSHMEYPYGNRYNGAFFDKDFIYDYGEVLNPLGVYRDEGVEGAIVQTETEVSVKPASTIQPVEQGPQPEIPLVQMVPVQVTPVALDNNVKQGRCCPLMADPWTVYLVLAVILYGTFVIRVAISSQAATISKRRQTRALKGSKL